MSDKERKLLGIGLVVSVENEFKVETKEQRQNLEKVLAEADRVAEDFSDRRDTIRVQKEIEKLRQRYL
jgi:hypothetical protein